MKCSRLRALCAALAVCYVVTAISSSSAYASPVYGTPAPHVGSRSVGNGLIASGTAASDWDNASISWDVVENGDGTNTITYTFAGFGILDEEDHEASQSISHVVIDLTDDAVNDPNAVIDAMIDGVMLPKSKVEIGNFDGITGAVKFDQGTETDTVVYKFTTDREIVYGDVFAKSGHVSLTNTGFGDQTSMDPLDYIARPDGHLPEVPEPSTVVLGILCSLALTTSRSGHRR